MENIFHTLYMERYISRINMNPLNQFLINGLVPQISVTPLSLSLLGLSKMYVLLNKKYSEISMGEIKLKNGCQSLLG